MLPRQAGALLLMRPASMERRSSNTKRARHRGGTGLDIPLVPPGGFENSPRGEIGDAGVDGPNPAFRPEEPGTVAVPGSIFLWCPRADSKTPPAGKLATRVSTVRIRRRSPQTRNGAAIATPSYSLVPPGGFEPSTPALGGHELLPYLQFFIFINISISAGNLAILPFLLFLISFLFHPFYTPSPLHFDLQG